MKQTWTYSYLWPCVKEKIRIGIAKPLTVFWFWWRQRLLPSCCFHQTSKDFLDNLSQLLLRNHCRNYSGLVLDMCSLGEAPRKLTNDMKSFTVHSFTDQQRTCRIWFWKKLVGNFFYHPRLCAWTCHCATCAASDADDMHLGETTVL